MLSSKSIFVLCFIGGSLLAQNSHSIKNITFDGNVKIGTKKLNALTKEYIGKPLTNENGEKIAQLIEEYYRKNNYALAYSDLTNIDSTNQTLTISIKKHTDFSARSLHEMKRLPLISGKINHIFFTGNEKLTTNYLSNIVLPQIGKENNVENRKIVLSEIQKVYRKHHYDLAYAELESDQDGVLTVAIKKHQNLKARSVHEGKL